MLFFKRFKIKRLNKKIKSLQQARVHNQPTEDSVKKEVSLYLALAKIYHSCHGCKKFPFAKDMEMECYRAASVLEHAPSQYILGKHLLDEGKFRKELQDNGNFASPNNEKLMNQLFEESLAYLIAAENLHHIQAKRLHGLCYINGWGVVADQKRGFDLIVSSIDDEGSWDKVPQIFASIGLNKPEFFSALAQHKKS